jgi:hypothetical protein
MKRKGENKRWSLCNTVKSVYVLAKVRKATGKRGNCKDD